MKIQFDSALSYQKDAINAIVDIFQGQEICDSNFTVYSPDFLEKEGNKMMKAGFTDIGYGNRLTLTEGQILSNVQNIQLKNGLKPSSRAEVDRSHLDFTIEMETGTGKTYVYLRTIMDLYKKYGFSKHIIVVPSIPIKEGVYKSLEITKDHLKRLNDNINYNFTMGFILCVLVEFYFADFMLSDAASKKRLFITILIANIISYLAVWLNADWLF